MKLDISTVLVPNNEKDELNDKYELFPGIFANKEQKEALDKLEDFLNSRDKKRKVFVLVGRGGTGKTTLLRKVLMLPSMKSKRVVHVQLHIQQKKY